MQSTSMQFMLTEFIGRAAMTIAPRVGASARRGVVVCGHTLTASQTRAQVEHLARWFDFIHHDDLADRVARPRGRPFCLLTFDDGKRSNATTIAPELERLGVPAVFYVVTRFLRDGRPLWFDRQQALVRALGQEPPGLDQATLKLLPLATIEARLDAACAEHRVTVDAESDDVRAMSWDEARDLARRGFTIGAHSLSHAIMTNEPEASAMSDIEQSIAEVSAEIGTRCSSYAFPNGNHTERLARHAVAAGVSSVMTTDPTWVDDRWQAWCVPRVQLFGEQGRFAVEAKLAVAAVGGILRNPDGSGRGYPRRRV